MSVIPAQAGIHSTNDRAQSWIPAYAGMTLAYRAFARIALSVVLGVISSGS
jgi:hypothetical protein